MGNYQSGDVVPESGIYQCTFCGMGNTFAGFLLSGGFDMGSLQQHKRTTQYFKKGTKFKECITCKAATAWSMKEKKDDE
jgi:hypothetical protein